MNCRRRHICWQSKRFYWEREPRWRTAMPGGSWSQVLWWCINFLVVFSQSFWLRVLPGGARLVQPRWMPDRRILGGGQTYGVSFWPFLNSSGWSWLISSVFLTRTSCHKTTHANGHYGAWPGWRFQSVCLPWQNDMGPPFLEPQAVSHKYHGDGDISHYLIHFFSTSLLNHVLLGGGYYEPETWSQSVFGEHSQTITYSPNLWE